MVRHITVTSIFEIFTTFVYCIKDVAKLGILAFDLHLGGDNWRAALRVSFFHLCLFFQNDFGIFKSLLWSEIRGQRSKYQIYITSLRNIFVRFDEKNSYGLTKKKFVFLSFLRSHIHLSEVGSVDLTDLTRLEHFFAQTDSSNSSKSTYRILHCDWIQSWLIWIIWQQKKS